MPAFLRFPMCISSISAPNGTAESTKAVSENAGCLVRQKRKKEKVRTGAGEGPKVENMFGGGGGGRWTLAFLFCLAFSLLCFPSTIPHINQQIGFIGRDFNVFNQKTSACVNIDPCGVRGHLLA